MHHHMQQSIQRIKTYFTNPAISNLLSTQLTAVTSSPNFKAFVLAVSLEGIHLYISFHKKIEDKVMENNGDQHQDREGVFETDREGAKGLDKDIQKIGVEGASFRKGSSASSEEWIDKTKNGGRKIQPKSGCYTIKINKTFPLPGGIRLHILNNCYSPRLFDCRDVMEDVLHGPWQHTNTLSDIFMKIDRFEKKLAGRSSHNLAMQMTGSFKIGDIFDIHQLKKFSAMQYFRDLSRQDGALLSTTGSHILTFKQIPTPLSSSNPKKPRPLSSKQYQLVRAYEYQCISQLYHSQNSQQIIITINKYRNLKSMEEIEKISRKYILQESQQFIQNVLKNIGIFQKVQMNLKLGTSWAKLDKSDKQGGICAKLEAVREAEDAVWAMDAHTDPKKREQAVDQLIQMYQGVIEYFIQRANSYYYIFCEKLKKLDELLIQ